MLMSQSFCTNVCKTIQSYIFTCFWPLSLKLGKLFNFKAIFPAASVNFRLLNKSEVESCKKFVEGLISNFIYGLNFAGDISQMKQNWRLFFHMLQYYTGVFSPSVCKFIAKHDYENYNSAEGCSFTFYNILQVYSLQVSANLLPSEIMKITTQEFLPEWHHLLGKTL